MRFILMRAGVLLVLAVFGVAAYSGVPSGGASSDELYVSFLDVGQGDATFIVSPDGTQVLIDGGPDSAVLRALARRMPFFDRTLDIVIATHMDRDHIGGLVEVLERYRVGTVILNGNRHDTPSARAFGRAVEGEGAHVRIARRDDRVPLGGGASLVVLFPDRPVPSLDSNTASIVAQLVHGTTRVLLPADAPAAVERYVMRLDGASLQSDVLKVAHHGSRTSSDRGVLDVVAARYAVISSAADNRYGHPHQEVVAALEATGATVLATAAEGTVTFVSDGTAIQRVPPSHPIAALLF